MKNITILITILILLTVAKTKSAEIIPVWNKVNEAGEIHDMEFLRGEDQFILLAGTAENSQIQIRQTLTGGLVTSYPMTSFAQPKLAITPDSNRFVLVTGGTDKIGATIELRDINNFSLINKDSLINTKDEISGKDLFYVFKEIVIDPIRPFAYVILERTNFTTTLPLDSNFLIVYNYETMEKVRDLTPIGFGAEFLSQLAVSKDGKYLATLNDRKAYLKVWDLETYEEIRSVKLWDEKLPNNDWSCVSKDIEFSSINSDKIYFSGIYPKESADPNKFYKYSIDSNVISMNIGYSGRLCFFENGKRVLVYAGYDELIFINLLNQKVELNIKPTLEYVFYEKTILSEKYGLFVGCNALYKGSLKYDSQTGISNNYEEEIIISPNPTGSFVNINLNCLEPQINYQINNLNGLLINSETIENNLNNVQIDFKPYPIGIYLLTIHCNNEVKTFKIIKEG